CAGRRRGAGRRVRRALPGAGARPHGGRGRCGVRSDDREDARVTTTVFIADDQAMVRQGCGARVAAQPDLSVVGDAADGRTAVAEVRRLRPDVVLMDVRMPEMNGIDAARAVMEARLDPPVRVLMLTTFD